MCEGVDAALGVVVHVAQYAIHHSRCATCGSNLSWLQYVQRQGVVGLVAAAVCYRCAFCQTCLLRCCLAYRALNGEGRHDVGNDVLGESEVVEQHLCGLLLLEVPHHAFRQSADGGVYLAGELHGEVVARQHNLINLAEELGFVLLHPCQLGSGEVARRVEQMFQTGVRTESLEGLLAIGHGARVTPDDSIAQHLLVFVHAYEAVHLIRDADGLDVLALGACLRHNLLQCQFGVAPPHLGVLLCPSRLHGLDGCLLLRIEGGGSYLS